MHNCPSNVVAKYQKPPFQDFQEILAFLASIGLATSTSCAFGLVGITSSFGDTSPQAMSDIKKSAILLCWASACFTVALAFIVAPQLLYTELVIVQIITQKNLKGWDKRLVRVAVGVFAWIPLGFQLVAMYLLAQSFEIFAPGPVVLARYGITVGVITVGGVTLVGVLSEPQGREKLLGFLTCGTRNRKSSDQ